MNQLPKNSCPDCGPDPVIHFAAWLGAATETYDRPIAAFFNFFGRKIGGLILKLPFAALSLPLFRLLAWLKLGTLTDKAMSDDNSRTEILRDSADKKGIKMWQFRFGGKKGAEFFVAEKSNRWRVFESIPRPERTHSAAYVWMDNKAVLREKFRQAGLPIAEGGECFSYKKALAIFQKIKKPAIVKPNLGSRSRHTTVNIENEEQLRRAFVSAKKISPIAIIEEELPGFAFRVSMISGRVAGIIRREPAYVTADGQNTIENLLTEENKRPGRQGPIFHIIPKDSNADQELARQKFNWQSVPPKGTIVIIQNKVSRAFGASNTDFTAATHPDNIALFEKAAAVVNDSLIGFDFMIQDITKSWHEQKCGFIEANSAPFIDLHHFPLFGEPQDAAGMLWDSIFPE